jgi:hypothetical protein
MKVGNIRRSSDFRAATCWPAAGHAPSLVGPRIPRALTRPRHQLMRRQTQRGASCASPPPPPSWPEVPPGHTRRPGGRGPTWRREAAASLATLSWGSKVRTFLPASGAEVGGAIAAACGSVRTCCQRTSLTQLNWPRCCWLLGREKAPAGIARHAAGEGRPEGCGAPTAGQAYPVQRRSVGRPSSAVLQRGAGAVVGQTRRCWSASHRHAWMSPGLQRNAVP